MIRIKDIVKELTGVVGWNAEGEAISPTIQDSSSGMYFQDGHPMVTISNLKNLAPLEKELPIFNPSTHYIKGDTVNSEGTDYIASIPSSNREPGANPMYWERYYPFSQWLTKLTESTISKVVNRLYTQKLVDKTAKSIAESKYLFDGAGRLADVITKSDSVVGLEIVPIRRPGATIKIDMVGLQFTKPGPITLHLMHSSQPDPIRSETFERRNAGGMEWFDMHDLFTPYQSAKNDAGGSWYLVYDEKQLPDGCEAVRKNKDWSKTPCSTCSRGEIQAYRLLSEYAELYPFRVDIDRGDFNEDFNSDFSRQEGLELWDIEKNIYTMESNYGINLCISIQCDITDYIIMNKDSFANLLTLQMAETVLRSLMFNPNTNINRSTFNVDPKLILLELEGDSESKRQWGINHALNKAYDAMDISLTGINTLCLPCTRNKGIRMSIA